MTKQAIAMTSIVMVTAAAMVGWSSSPSQQPKTMPLIPMMQLLLDDIQQVDTGIYTENFEMLAEGARNIARHPVMTEKDKKLISKTLGSKMKQFVAFDKTVHHHADSMRMAAHAEKMQEVLRHYRIVQQGCVSCHQNFRNRNSKARKAP